MNIFDVSLETANKFYSWGWRASVIAAVVTAIAIGFLYWGTRVRDRDFEVRMTTLNTEAGNARERAAKLEEEAAALRLELAQRMPRKVTSEQRQTVIGLLAASAASKEPVEFNTPIADGEAVSFSEQIKDALMAAGFPVDDVPGPEKLISISSLGAFLWFKDRDHPPAHALAIQRAFMGVGISLVGVLHPEFSDQERLVIVVGPHP